MGAIQSSINSMIGTAGTAAVISQHLGQQKEQVEATKKSNDLAKKQWDALNNSTYGQQLLNAQAERKALASLMNAQYPGSLLKNFNPETRIENAQKRADFMKLKESYDTAKEKELEAGINYNYPEGKQMTRTLTEEEEVLEDGKE